MEKNCPNCNSDGGHILVLNTDTFGCSCCEERIINLILLCTNCGTYWKETNDNIFELHTLDEMMGDVVGFNPTVLQTKINKLEDNTKLSKTDMSSLVHKCIECNELAYKEITTKGQEVYRCTSCDKTWSVNK